MVWLPGRPETEDAAVLMCGRAMRREFGRVRVKWRRAAVAVDGLENMFVVVALVVGVVVVVVVVDFQELELN